MFERSRIYSYYFLNVKVDKMATSSADETTQSDAGDLLEKISDKWDPCTCRDWENEKPTQQCFLRIKRFLKIEREVKYLLSFFTGVTVEIIYRYIYLHMTHEPLKDSTGIKLFYRY